MQAAHRIGGVFLHRVEGRLWQRAQTRIARPHGEGFEVGFADGHEIRPRDPAGRFRPRQEIRDARPQDGPRQNGLGQRIGQNGKHCGFSFVETDSGFENREIRSVGETEPLALSG